MCFIICTISVSLTEIKANNLQNKLNFWVPVKFIFQRSWCARVSQRYLLVNDDKYWQFWIFYSEFLFILSDQVISQWLKNKAKYFFICAFFTNRLLFLTLKVLVAIYFENIYILTLFNVNSRQLIEYYMNIRNLSVYIYRFLTFQTS